MFGLRHGSQGRDGGLTGRAAGYSKGKGGPCICSARRKNFYGGHGIVGAAGSNRHRPGLCPQAQEGRADRDLLLGDGAVKSGAGL